MKIFIFLLCAIFAVMFSNTLYGQLDQLAQQEKARQQILSKTDTLALKRLGSEFEQRYKKNKASAIEWAKKKGYLIKGEGVELQGLQNGIPRYFTTNNSVAAKTVSTDKVMPGGSLGLNLEGQGIKIGIWDEGAVYTSHSSFRESSSGPYHAFFEDSTGSQPQDHATHVAGTMIANNNTSSARGMADKANLYSYDWNHDIAEMTNATSGSNPIILSNHSYGDITGWFYGDLRNAGSDAWYWTAGDSYTSDPRFGQYDSLAWDLDILAKNAPYYTIVYSAGNDRGAGPAANSQHYVFINGTWTSSTKYREKDGGLTGFNCLSHQGLAKNIITVGAIDDIPNGYQSTSDVKQVNTSFSNWGPTNDGRIKPDIVANGDNLYSTVYHNLPNTNSTGSYFYSMNGTSMAAPNLTGSMALLLQYYYQTHSQTYPLASTLKALVIHTADEAGSSAGPDYKYGWGLLNTAKAAQVISLDVTKATTIQEITLNKNIGQTYTQSGIYSKGLEPLKVTIVWTDSPQSNLNSVSLVNDLDIRITGNGQTYYPYVLNPGYPSNAATTGDNTKDNVEQIYIAAPVAGEYTITVSHKGTLQYNQVFSMIITGTSNPEANVTIKQLDENLNPFGQAAYWNSTAWQYVNPTDVVTLGLGTQHFLSTQDFKPSTTQKFNQWVDNASNKYYRNYEDIPLAITTTTIQSNFIIANNATIQSSLEGAAPGGSLNFQDPWLTDLSGT